MAARPTNFQEFDADDEYEIIPPSELEPESGIVAAKECCVCEEGGGSHCSDESHAGEVGTLLVAHTVAFWYTK